MEEKQQALRGLTAAEVEQRVRDGKVNIATTVKTKSIKRIFIDNICTVFNGINVLLFVLLLLVGSYKNLLFIGVVLFNTVIGIVQEIRSKQSVDKLTILTESKLTVLRGGKEVQLNKDELVLDDVILLTRGNQVPADCILIDGECNANESLLTGESDLIPKRSGDELLSGSFIAAGNCYCRVNRVGADSYAAKINNEAKYLKKNNSQILQSFKTIIKICSFIIFPVGILMFVMKYFVQHQELTDTVVSTVGALVGMIPGGMILLTSGVLAVSVIRLAKKKVLVNEMYCIETLARVDVICLDKTGTLTAEIMNVHDVIPIDCDRDEIMTALSSIASVDEVNATAEAVHKYTENIEPLSCRGFTPFSSETKWSGGNFENGRTYIMGAAELCEKYHPTVCASRAELPVIEEPSYNLSKYHDITVKPFTVDRALEDGDTVMLGETELRFILTPGHTMGSGCYMTDDCIFSGDTLFCSSVGRTDFPTSSMRDMMASVERLKNLEGDYRVYPGHDIFTSLERERKHNPVMR